jgi:choline dehydrogenase-like flavoprotein
LPNRLHHNAATRLEWSCFELPPRSVHCRACKLNINLNPVPSTHARRVQRTQQVFPHLMLLSSQNSTDLMFYTRGARDDFDRYAKLTGDAGWSWDRIFPYFLKVSSNSRHTVPPNSALDRMRNGFRLRTCMILGSTFRISALTLYQLNAHGSGPIQSSCAQYSRHESGQPKRICLARRESCHGGDKGAARRVPLQFGHEFWKPSGCRYVIYL